MRLFLDRNTAPSIANALACLLADRGWSVLAHDDDPRFTPTTPDPEWIAALHADPVETVVLSRDTRIIRNKVNIAAFAQTGLTIFECEPAWSHASYFPLAAGLVAALPGILKAVSDQRGPTVYKLQFNGRITKLCDTKALGSKT